ncbi:MAG: adenylate/guanylate cyclase domain-containing protein [Rhodopila sp.]
MPEVMGRGIRQPFTFTRSRRQVISRRLAAIIGLDIAGYSLMMGASEEDTHLRVGACLERIYKEVERSHGTVFSFGGDGLMAEIPSAVEAMKCALRIQADQARRNHKLPSDKRIRIRIGVNTGEVVLQNDRVGGNTVNIAARLEAVADPGGIALSEEVFRQAHRVITAEYTFRGEHALKNIREPVRVYSISAGDCAAWAGVPALPRTTGTDAAVTGIDYRPSLAVMPFRTLHKDQTDAWFAEGMADDIIRALGSLHDILVISRSSTQALVGAPLDLRRIGHDLDVRYVLHGSVRRSADSLRVAVELCEAHSGTIVWADRFDGQMDGLFELQDRIAVSVATSIAPHLRERDLSRALRKRPDSLAAYDLTLQALRARPGTTESG